VLRGLVNNVPVWVLVPASVLVVLALVLGGVLLVRRLVPATREGFDAEVSSQMLGVVATLFGLLLAFVVVLAFQGYSDASDNARLEADSLAEILRDSGAFDAADRRAVNRAVGAYVRVVVEEEWPLLRSGKSSPRASEALNGLFVAMQDVHPRTPAAYTFYEDSVRRLNDALAARRARIDDAAGGLSSIIAVLLLVGTLVILGYVVLVGSRSTAFHLVGAGAIAIVLGFSLVVLLTYNYPYSGDLAVDSTPFHEGALAQYFPPGP